MSLISALLTVHGSISLSEQPEVSNGLRHFHFPIGDPVRSGSRRSTRLTTDDIRGSQNLVSESPWTPTAPREVSNRLSFEDPRKRWGPGLAEGRITVIAACRTCGTEPLEHARFCHGCGSPVNDADTRAEYKQVTVLFADVVHSMDIAAAVGAERLREIMAELVDRCAAVVQRYGGTVDKFTGDGIMAVFGAPVALEDHAVRACLAALGVQEEAKRLAGRGPRSRRCGPAAAGWT